MISRQTDEHCIRQLTRFQYVLFLLKGDHKSNNKVLSYFYMLSLSKVYRDDKFVTKWTNLELSGGGNIHDTVGIDVDASGNVYMTNRDNNRVEVLPAAGTNSRQ